MNYKYGIVRDKELIVFAVILSPKEYLSKESKYWIIDLWTRMSNDIREVTGWRGHIQNLLKDLITFVDSRKCDQNVSLGLVYPLSPNNVNIAVIVINNTLLREKPTYNINTTPQATLFNILNRNINFILGNIQIPTLSKVRKTIFTLKIAEFYYKNLNLD